MLFGIKLTKLSFKTDVLPVKKQKEKELKIYGI